MEAKIDAHTRKDTGAPFLAGGRGAVFSARALRNDGESTGGNRRNDIALGQESPEEEERLRADLVRKAKERGLDPWKQFKVFPPVEIGSRSRDVVDTRWVLALREVRGGETVKARLGAKG